MNSLSPIQDVNAIALNDQADQFLKAVFTTNDFDLFVDGVRYDGPIADTDPTKLTVSPLTPSGVAFLWSYLEDANANSYKDFSIPPTAAMYRAGAMVVCWALDVCENLEAVKDVADALGMEPPEFPVPVPNDDWKLIHCDQNFTSLCDFRAKMPVEVETSAKDATPDTGLGKYRDATIMRAYHEQDYTREIVITIGAAAASKNWKPVRQPLGGFLATLCAHKEGTKDGHAFVLGDMVQGQRLKVAVKSLYAVGLDIDTGTPSSVVDQALMKFGCTAVRYTTHSFGKGKTEFKKDKVTKFANGAEIDDALIQRYLREDQHWDESIVKTASYEGEDHDDRGIIVLIKHAPIPKHRIVVPLEQPFEIGKEADTQKEAMETWAKVPAALAAELNLPFDKSCVDPSRLFYFPRHAKGKSFEISLFGGPLFDFTKLVLDDPLDDLVKLAGKGSSKSVTQEGRDLGRWSIKRAAGFQIVDVIEAYAPDRIRGGASSNGKTIDCPFDDDHSNMGDRNDTGCFVVNAGYGPSEVFTASCRHESCRDKTNLDMLGKMLKDAWFDKAVLEDENFNAIVADTPEKPKSEAKKKIEKEDEARAEYQKKIDALTKESGESQILEAIKEVAAANLGRVPRSLAIDAITKKTPLSKTEVREELSKAEPKSKHKTKDGVSVDKSGIRYFNHNGEFNFDDAVDACLAALRAKNRLDEKPTYCEIGGDPYRLDIKKDGRADYVELSPRGIWSACNSVVKFVRHTDNWDGTRDKVPEDVAADVYERTHTVLPPKPIVINVPRYTADGSLIVTPGFHIEINTLLVTDESTSESGLDIGEIPQSPTEAEMQEAVRWIKTELFSDFPFTETKVGESSPYIANAFAMILTPFMREMIEGRTPLFMIDKPKPGSGATLLAALSMMLFEGVAGPFIKYSNNPEEMHKALVSVIKGTRTHIIIDNVRVLIDDTLLIFLTMDPVQGRELGHSRFFEAPNKFNWVATGKNPMLSEEMERRTCRIRLDAPKKKLRERTFRHPNISGMTFEQFVLKNRGLAVRHVLTMIEYWQANEAVKSKHNFPNFDDWAKKVGGVLDACGITGFLDYEPPIAANTDDGEADEFLCWFLTMYNVKSAKSASDIFEDVTGCGFGIVKGAGLDQRRSNFRDALAGLVGYTFKDFHYIFRSSKSDNGLVEYYVEEIPAEKSK